MKMLKSVAVLISLSVLLLAAESIADTTADATSANTPPVSDPGGPYAGCVGQTIVFDGTGSFDVDPGGSIVSYEWDFGDGHTGTGPTPGHYYDFAGDYVVVLTVTDDVGATDSDTTTAYINGASAIQSRSWGEIKVLLGD